MNLKKWSLENWKILITAFTIIVATFSVALYKVEALQVRVNNNCADSELQIKEAVVYQQGKDILDHLNIIQKSQDRIENKIDTHIQK